MNVATFHGRLQPGRLPRRIPRPWCAGALALILLLTIIPALNAASPQWDEIVPYPSVSTGFRGLQDGDEFWISGGLGLDRYDGCSWLAQPELAFATCRGLTKGPGDLVYSCGSHPGGGATGVNRRVGGQWETIGVATSQGFFAFLMDLVYHGGNLYLAGRFDQIFANVTYSPIANLARWDGTAWSAVGDPGCGPSCSSIVNCLTSDGSDLLIGGHFTEVGGVPAANIARFDGTWWHAFGAGIPDDVTAIIRYAGDVYAATQSSTDTASLFRWDGAVWAVVATFGWTGPGATIDDLEEFRGDLYAVGHFSSVDGTPANEIARYNGSQWEPLPSDFGPYQHARGLAVSNDKLAILGQFDDVNPPDNAGGVVFWNGFEWAGRGVNQVVRAMVQDGSDVYIGGAFTTAGDVAMAHITRLVDDVDYQDVGGGIAGSVYCLEVAGGTVLAGGDISSAGGTPVANIAAFDGTQWNALGDGVDNRVNAIAVSGGDTYAAGRFTSAGNAPASHIARWDGTQWHTLGPGLDGNVEALVFWNGTLYAGGWFTHAGGAGASRMAAWDGSAWSGGMNVDGTVYALAVHQGDLYAAGAFFNAGGAPANRVARWDGDSWSPVANGLGGVVLTLESAGGALLAAGSFTTTGTGATARRLALFDGSAWSEYAGGTNGGVYAIATTPQSVHIGGVFTTAGACATVKNVTRIDNDLPTPVLPGPRADGQLALRAFPNPFNPSVTLTYHVARTSPGSLRIYDIRGGLVRTLTAGTLPAGEQRVVWDGSDDGGRRVASGVYLARAVTTSGRVTTRIVLLK
ncbi:MAG TPA: FlgD immunoglobulin-like domain containing protein [Candidatus Krumholzibacteria bacterium]|nr:FlgD immunoglobulin-like domain containing protein [Candidatus Krumholzibacteria bacterium]